MSRPDDNQPVRRVLQNECAVRAALDVIKGRWKPSILFALKDGPRRFSEIQAALEEVSPQALTGQLKQLEAHGIISRTAFAEVPVRVEYRITEFGRTLSTILDQLDEWGQAYLSRQAE
jgi:DNA-binding HxlR family transcriptional regulator